MHHFIRTRCQLLVDGLPQHFAVSSQRSANHRDDTASIAILALPLVRYCVRRARKAGVLAPWL